MTTAGVISPVAASSGGNQGPPDLEELWRDFNRRLSGLFGKKGGGNDGGGDGGGRYADR